jgi:hypothetical protein
MFRLVLACLAGTLAAAPALAHSSHHRPYAIEEICDSDGFNCTAHMRYAPGQNMAGSPRNNYWYATPRHYVRPARHWWDCHRKHHRHRWLAAY